MKNARRDNAGNDIQAFSAQPSLCKVPVAIAAGATYGGLDLVGLEVIHFRPVGGEVKVYFNNEPTKYMIFDADTEHEIVLHWEVASIHFVNSGAAGITLCVWGM